MVVVVARITAKTGQGDALAEELVKMVDWVTENEPRTLTYICNRSTKNADEFVFFERYPDQAAVDAHAGSEQFTVFVQTIGGLLGAAPDIQTFEEIAAKL
jgi:quinol monooxygenase YgiN